MTEPIASPPITPQAAPSQAPDLAPFVGAVLLSEDFETYLAGLEDAAVNHATEHLGAAQPLAAFLGKAFIGYALSRLYRS